MCVTTVIYIVCAWYCDNVLPREHGTPLPWNFFMDAQYWKKAEIVGASSTRMVPIGTSELKPTVAMNNNAVTGVIRAAMRLKGVLRKVRARMGDSVFEALDPDAAGVVESGRALILKGVVKSFPSDVPGKVFKSVDNIDLTMVEGQIFVLLGHNGAGKTTTCSMISGLLQPTEGRISIYGYEIPRDLDHIRHRVGLGVCPQHDVLFPYLTVRDHLLMFGGLKGIPAADLPSAVNDIIKTVGLAEKVCVCVCAFDFS